MKTELKYKDGEYTFLVDGKPVENVASITIVANPGRAPTVTIYTIPRELVFNSEDEEDTPDSV